MPRLRPALLTVAFIAIASATPQVVDGADADEYAGLFGDRLPRDFGRPLRHWPAQVLETVGPDHADTISTPWAQRPVVRPAAPAMHFRAEEWSRCGPCQALVKTVVTLPSTVLSMPVVNVETVCNPVTQPYAEAALGFLNPVLPKLLLAECRACVHLSGGRCSIAALATRVCTKVGVCG